MSNFLDVDDTLLARTLLLGNKLSADDLGGESSEIGFGKGSQLAGPKILTPSERKEQAQCKFIIPHPGICVKTSELTTRQKVFINLCKSEDVPEPDEYFTDEQMANVLSNGHDDDIKDITLPMSLGEKHIEKDKSGNLCAVFDVVISKEFFDKKIISSEMYRTFLVVVMIEGLEEKFKIDLDKDNYTILSHKKSMGKLNPHFVKSRPSIKELKQSVEAGDFKTSTSITPLKRALVEEIDSKSAQLDFEIIQVSNSLAKAEIKLPNLKNTKKLSVTLGADRIIVDSPVGLLDIFVPLDIHQEESKAEYNMESYVLSLHLPLVTKP